MAVIYLEVPQKNPFVLNIDKVHNLVCTSNDHEYHKKSIYIQAKIHGWKAH
jgi:hypothetical protein